MEQWEAIKEEYFADDSVTLLSLAQKHGISYQALKKQSAANGWAKQKKALRKAQALEAQLSAKQTAQEPPRTLAQMDKINRIAEKLLANIEEGTALFEKPTHIATLTGALKEVTAILRDVNEIPNQKQRFDFEMSRRKLELEQSKRTADEGQKENGVVILPEVIDSSASH